MKHVYTETSTKDVALMRPVRGLLGGDSLANNAPLAKVIAHYVDENFMQEVAADTQQRPPALDRHHQSRRRAARGVGHGRDRLERPSGIASTLPHRAAGLGGDPRGVPAGLRQGRRQWRGL